MANAYTGHIVENIEQVPAEERGDYRVTPENLKEEVKKALNGESETTVDINAPGPIQDWMREEREKDSGGGDTGGEPSATES